MQQRLPSGHNHDMKTDTLFYEIFQTQPGLLLELLGQGADAIVNYDFRSIEIKQTAFRIDGLLIPKRPDPNALVYFSEVQFQKDPQLYHRFFAEIYTYLKQYPATPDWHGILDLSGNKVYVSEGVRLRSSRMLMVKF
jgi:predicted transposase YdaD